MNKSVTAGPGEASGATGRLDLCCIPGSGSRDFVHPVGGLWVQLQKCCLCLSGQGFLPSW
jgi:hypothetical protein